ncbi:glycosyltransferase [Mycolicibacterium holsaticum]|uniref:glycosyltransferase n=1 Tax=Mycolicibacterium holsaticum TaxID=152142 RepID=UPI000A076DA9
MLSMSETFIINQVEALTRWDATLAGTRFVTPSLAIGDAVSLYGKHRPVSSVKAQVWRWTGRSRKLDRFLTEWRPAVIHAHFGPDATYILPSAQRQSIPLVVTFHGSDATSQWRRRGPSVYKSRLQRLFRQAHTIHAVSDFIANQLLELGAPPEKVVRVYIGIPCTGEVVNNRRTKNSILFVGRLVAKKGLGDLLAALSQLPEELKRTELHVIGDGPLKEVWQKEATVLKVNAHFHGARSSEYVFNAMRRSTVFCVPSKTAPNGDSEGLGMVFLEAGLNSLPTVSYAHGGVPEAVSDGVTGLLAPEGDTAALAQNLSHLMSDTNRATRLGVAARERVLQSFDIRKQIARIENLYDQAAASTHRPS